MKIMAVVTTVVLATVTEIYRRPQSWKQQLVILTLARTLSIHTTENETSNQRSQNVPGVLWTFEVPCLLGC